MASYFALFHPWFLLLAPIGVAVLYYIYRLKEKGEKVKVPSLYLILKLQYIKLQKRKFKPPTRFWLEVLIILLLTLAASGFSRKEQGEKVALLLDNSFSTLAYARGKEALFTLIKEKAEEVIRKTKAAYIDLYQTSPVLSSPANSSLTPSSVLSYIKRIHPFLAEDNLTSAISALLRRDVYSKVIVITDKHLAGGSSVGAFKEWESPAGDIQVYSVAPLSETLDNIAITDLYLSQTEGLIVEISNFSAKDAVLRIVLNKVLKGGSTFEVDSKPIYLDSFNSSVVKFKRFFSNTPYKININFMNTTTNYFTDKQPYDDESFFYFTPSEEKGVVVSPFSLEELGLNKNLSIRLEKGSLQDLKKGGINFAIIHRTALEEFPKINALIVLPPNQGVIQAEGLAKKFFITNWDKDSVLLEYLKVPLLEGTEGVVLKPFVWTEEVISSKKGALLLAGRKGGHKYVISGIELFPYRGKSSPARSILLLNILKWLSQGSLRGGYEDISFLLEREEQIVPVVTLSDTVSAVEKAYPSSGIYRVKGSKERIVAVNYFKRAESDYFNNRLHLNSLTNLAEEKESKDKKREEVFSRDTIFFLKAGLFLLLLDLVIFVFYPYFWKLSAKKRGLNNVSAFG